MPNFLDIRFAWVPPFSFIVASLGYFVGGYDKYIGVYVVAVGIAGFILGNILMVFFPRVEHRKYFGIGSKMMVLGFTLVVSSFVLGLSRAQPFSDGFYYAGLVLFVLGMFGVGKRVRDKKDDPGKD